MFAQFTQLFVKLSNLILVRLTRHVLDHLSLARPSKRFVIRALRLGPRVAAAALSGRLCVHTSIVVVIAVVVSRAMFL